MDEKTIARFWSKVDRKGPSECWEWTAYRNRKGYGMLNTGGRPRMTMTHRISWQLQGLDIPEGMIICHRCDNPACVNPGHLFLGTHGDNARDRNAKLRAAPRHGGFNGRAKLTEERVRTIRNMVASGLTQVAVAAQLGIKTSAVNDVMRRTWRHLL